MILAIQSRGMNERIVHISTTATIKRMITTVRFVSISQAEAASLSACVLRTAVTAGSLTSAPIGRSGNVAVGSEIVAIKNLLTLNKTQPNVGSACISD